MREQPAARLHPCDRIGEEERGRRALPFRIGGRKVRTDVAIRQRAQDRICNRVGEDVRIGMSFEPVIVRDFQPAKPDMAARPESMDVKTLTATDIREIAEEAGFGVSKIVNGRQLHVLLLSVEDIDRMSGALHDGGVVG